MPLNQEENPNSKEVELTIKVKISINPDFENGMGIDDIDEDDLESLVRNTISSGFEDADLLMVRMTLLSE